MNQAFPVPKGLAKWDSLCHGQITTRRYLDPAKTLRGKLPFLWNFQEAARPQLDVRRKWQAPRSVFDRG